MATDLYSLIGELFLAAVPSAVYLAAIIFLIYAYLIWKNGLSQTSAVPLLLFLTYSFAFAFPDTPDRLLFKLYCVAGMACGTIIGLGVLSFVGGSFEQGR